MRSFPGLAAFTLEKKNAATPSATIADASARNGIEVKVSLSVFRVTAAKCDHQDSHVFATDPAFFGRDEGHGL